METRLSNTTANNNNTNILEKKARYLEETLDRMTSYSGFLYAKIRKLKRQKEDTSKLSEKLKSVEEGVAEVREKCEIIWSDIARIERERYTK